MINKYLAAGAVVESFIEPIFNEVCEGTVYRLIRKEYPGGPPAPGTTSHPTFEVLNTYSERIIAAFGASQGEYCNEMDFRPYYLQIEDRLREAIQKRVKEWEQSHPTE